MPTPNADDLRGLAQGLRSLLAFQGELGLAGLDFELAPAVLPSARPHAGAARPAAAEAHHDPQAPVAQTLNAAHAPSTRASSAGFRPRANGSATSARHLEPELRALREELGDCRRCALHAGRTHLVFGSGRVGARLMFIGGAPGRDEDLQGAPIVGEAGQLLERMVKAMGLSRADVYIADLVKCRPPKLRTPEPSEVAACVEFVRRQVGIVGPEVVVTLGELAAQTLLGTEVPLAGLRGEWRDLGGVALLPTFHPTHLLDNPADKRPAWEDLQKVMQRLGLAPRKRTSPG